jgi:ABC-2 type transport system ATP-binding protein
MEPAVNIRNMAFNYQGRSMPFFSHFNLEIAQGERFGLFGPNGAGKTTLMNLMTGLLSCTEGSISLLGREITKNDKSINNLFGFVPQELSFYQELSPLENLEFFAACSGLRRQEVNTRIEELLILLGLTAVRDTPLQKLSGGMKRRVNLAIGVVHSPALLFLDEPTVGVDVQTRFAIIEYLKVLNKNGTTLIYTSHQLSEAEALCNRIALIDEGKILAHDELPRLLAEHGQDGLEGLFINLTDKNHQRH